MSEVKSILIITGAISWELVAAAAEETGMHISSKNIKVISVSKIEYNNYTLNNEVNFIMQKMKVQDKNRNQ